jgi:hypothetical protein
MKSTHLILRIPNPHQKPTWHILLKHFRAHKPLFLRRAIEGLPKSDPQRDLLLEVLWHLGRLSKSLGHGLNVQERRRIQRAYRIRFFLNRKRFTHDGATLTIPAFNVRVPLVLKGNKVIKRIWFNADKLFLELVTGSKHGRMTHLTPAEYQSKAAQWSAAQEIANAPDLGPTLG